MPALALPESLRVFERGWLSSNNVLFFDDDGAVSLVDSGYVAHAEQTLQLAEHAAGGRPLRRIVNTHLHSDHCGGNALLRMRTGCAIFIPPGHADAVAVWDEARLSYRELGQRCPRFEFDGLVEPGSSLTLGALRWQVIAAPGHDAHQVMLWCASERLLISADVLWERGFGAIFSEVEGESGFDEQRAMLDCIADLAPLAVIPGHGAPFADAGAALTRAYARLEALASDPVRNARSTGRALLKFFLLEVRTTTIDGLVAHLGSTRFWQALHARYFSNLSAPAMIELFLDDLVASGAARRHDGQVFDAERI